MDILHATHTRVMDDYCMFAHVGFCHLIIIAGPQRILGLTAAPGVGGHGRACMHVGVLMGHHGMGWAGGGAGP